MAHMPDSYEPDKHKRVLLAIAIVLGVVLAVVAVPLYWILSELNVL